MNLHPIVVHFPIALLSIYCLMELIRFRKITGKPYWFYTKAILVCLGGLGALAALFTGSMAKHLVNSGEFIPAITNFRQVVSMHENFAKLSVAIFGILAAGYVCIWLDKENFSAFAERIHLGKLWYFVLRIAKFFIETRFVIVLALLGLVSITITGGLGGVMVYGPSADPFFGVIYKLLFPH